MRGFTATLTAARLQQALGAHIEPEQEEAAAGSGATNCEHLDPTQVEGRHDSVPGARTDTLAD